MGDRLVGREPELRVLRTWLTEASEGPSLLVLGGEPGIGKTTLWQAGISRAAAVGFRVLSTRAQATESAAAYSALAELLGGQNEYAFDQLPPAQRQAVDRLLMRADARNPATGQRAVAAAVRSVLERLAEMSPVLVAVDDLQWLDPPSRHVLFSVARRCTGRIGFLATARTDPAGEQAMTELELRDPARMHRLDLRAFSLGALQRVLAHHLGHSLTRATMVQIHRESGGNPFYALELARMSAGGSGDLPEVLPATLSDLVQARISNLSDETKAALLAASCLPVPTIAAMASVTRSEPHDVVALLEAAERHGIIEIRGARVLFTHPLLARGVYADAAPAMRRVVHERLAQLLDDAELKARHLALAVDGADARVVRALDDAAGSARVRGAPAAAADLLELALARGGDTPERSIAAAAHHFQAGGSARARALLTQIVDRLPAGPLRAEALHLLGLVCLYDNSTADAAVLLRQAVEQPGVAPDRQVPMLLKLALVEYNAGGVELPKRRAEQAVALATHSQRADLMAQATTTRAMLRFLTGEGLDEEVFRRALDVGDPVDVPLDVRPQTQYALIKLYSHQVDEAAVLLEAIAQRCIERGEESELMLVGFTLVLAQVWRGDLAAAQRTAEDSMERATQLGGDLPMFIALTVRTVVDAHAGRIERARSAGAEAMMFGRRCQSGRLGMWAPTALGFLELSLGNHEAALRHLEPLLAEWRLLPESTEIMTTPFLPDAAEAMIELGRLDDAERLVDGLESNGRRLDRPWMLATGARCRCLLQAARGDMSGAAATAERALREHERLSMPFELARTQLVLGQSQRRRRQRDAAAATVQAALHTFERLGTRFWVERARWELARLAPARRSDLTVTERRTAELAAAGRTNKEIAAELFVSTKTVELNLSRAYRKLGIRSRAELWRAITG